LFITGKKKKKKKRLRELVVILFKSKPSKTLQKLKSKATTRVQPGGG